MTQPVSDRSEPAPPVTSPGVSSPEEHAILRAEPGPPLGTERPRTPLRPRLCGASGGDAARQLQRLKQALGPAASPLLLNDPTGLQLIADWDCCEFAGQRVSDLRRWREIVDSGRLGEVHGAFALAWVDRQGQICLARDGIGHRDLYYAPLPDGIVFASTLQALLSALDRPARLYRPALPRYLSCAYVPGRQTLAEGVYKLLPGEILRCRGAHHQSAQFFELPAEPSATEWQDEETLRARLRATLEQTIADLLPAADDDRPVGATLSGGIDSSLVVALAQRARRQRLQTFALSFGPEYKNELPHSSLVAHHCGTQHRIIELPPRVVLRHMDQAVALLSDPNGDPLTVPNAICFREASNYVGIVLNGEGGDPCFGGPKNVPMLLAELLGDGEGRSNSGAHSRAQSYLRAHQKCYDDLADLLLPDVLADCQSEALETEVAGRLSDERWPSFVGKLMALNVLWKGAYHILPKVDELSAPFAVLPRSPLFDRRVVELAFQIPATLKLSGSTEKYLLKRAVADVVPQSICDRPKSGMLVPVEGWFSGPLLPYARERLLDGLRPYGLFQMDFLERLLSGKLPGLRPRRGVKIWLLLTLEAWLREVLRPGLPRLSPDGVGDRMEIMADRPQQAEGAQVLKRAIQLAERDRDDKEALAEKQVLVEAAEELGVPAHFVDKAAAELERDRQRALATRRRMLWVGAAATASLVALMASRMLLSPPHPVTYSVAEGSGHFALSKNPETQATLRFAAGEVGQVAVVQVERFVAASDAKYHVNLDASEGLPAVEKYRRVVFRSRGAGLQQLRLFLEAGPHERWRSPPIALSSAWNEHRLRLSEFEHQRRDGETWRRAGSSSPHDIQRLSFKLGHFMNDVTAQGEASITDLRFE